MNISEENRPGIVFIVEQVGCDMKNKYLSLMACLMLIASFGISAQEDSSSIDQDCPLLTAEEAIERAIEYTGFDKADGYDSITSAFAELVISENDNTPFIAEKIQGKNVWQITFYNIPVGQGCKTITEREFQVTLYPETGKLIKIFSVSDHSGSLDTLPQPSATVAEKWFKDRKYVFNMLPDEMCNITFWEALQKAWIACPSVTKIIKAYYWDISGGERDFPYTWLIIFRGIRDPLPAAGGPMPNWALNFMMSVIDAETGIHQFATTAPYDNEDAMKRRQSRPPLDTERDAKYEAIFYSGFSFLSEEQFDRGKVSVHLERMEKVKIPFIWHKYRDKPIWVVTIRDVRLYDSRMADGQEDSHRRTFTFYLDPQTRHLLRIHSKLDGVIEDYNTEPPVEIIEEQMSANELFLAIPDIMPPLTFLDALQHTHTSFYDCKEIIAHCVTYTSNGWRDTLNVWSIDLRGFPPEKMLSMHYDWLHELDKGHQRSIIDAVTGTLYSASSAPVTIPPEVQDSIERNR
jgi:hypothetical protein